MALKCPLQKLSLCLINESLHHGDIWGSRDITPPFLSRPLTVFYSKLAQKVLSVDGLIHWKYITHLPKMCMLYQYQVMHYKQRHVSVTQVNCVLLGPSKHLHLNYWKGKKNSMSLAGNRVESYKHHRWPNPIFKPRTS